MTINFKVALITTFLSLPKQSLFLKPPDVVILFYLVFSLLLLKSEVVPCDSRNDALFHFSFLPQPPGPRPPSRSEQKKLQIVCVCDISGANVQESTK